MASTAAFAQSTVTISGGLNAGYGAHTRGTLGELGNNAPAYSLTSNQAAANNITFSGTEDLGGGLKASFSINQRFNPANGFNASNGSGAIDKVNADADDNDAFAQNVTVALSGSFGEIKAGRFTGVVQGPVGGYDPFGTDNQGVSLSFPQVRNNGMIAYTSPDLSGLKIAAQLTLANNNTAALNGTALVADGQEVAITYAAGPVSAMYGWTKHGIAGQPVTNTVAGAYNFGVATVSLMYGDTTVLNRKETAIGVKAPLGAVTVKAGYLRQDQNGLIVNRAALGATYALSKRTSVIADMNKDTNTDAAFYFGARHTF